jgi:hypothetical protein
MSGTHPAEETLQQYVLDRTACSPGAIAHIEGCPDCRAAAAAYTVVVEGLRTQPRPAFDFDLAGAVVRRLREDRVEKRKSGSVSMAAMIALGAGVPAWLFRKSAYFVFTDMPALFYWGVVCAAAVVVGFFILRLNKKYQDVINLINK